MGTIFDTSRRNSSFEIADWDPRVCLNITQDTLNDALSAITISAISLGTWWDTVPVTITTYRNTYKFSNPLNLILPYSICLVISTVFIAIGIWSLLRNDMPVADGGFLQVMIATRGNTRMDRLVTKNGVVATDRVPKELKELAVRYGELVTAEAGAEKGKRFGFGTIEETRPLRKRK